MHAIPWTKILLLIATNFTILSKDRKSDHENLHSAEIHWLSPGKGLKRHIEHRRDTHFYFTAFYDEIRLASLLSSTYFQKQKQTTKIHVICALKVNTTAH